MPSRRAIACVTCAKAKTKCNRALPSCSRCITKGINCQPRSTRRTSDNYHRSHVKKPNRPARRHYATNPALSLDLTTPPISLSSSRESGSTPAASYADTESAAKSSRQDLELSGYPMLTPLPSQEPQVFNDCCAYVQSSEYDTNIFAQAVDTNTYLNLGAISPQTPSPVIMYEPVSVVSHPDCYLYPESWPSEAYMSDEAGFEIDVTNGLPEMWATPDSATMVPIAHMPWLFSDPLNLPQHMLDESASHIVGMASLAQYQFRNTLDPVRPEWTFHGSTDTDMTIVTSAQFVCDMNSATSYAITWEVPFLP
ncbi:hypothetical protein G6011_00541 [Alternaria panax]|uniref:Zn(2)-C6 fungal-type domain-containing protein n=1 Tax=Alternaria panax TaxID=48097 RepID=A0AAD4IIV5_9PLEO|nr:hypothetical protein G6011_00541 [Alternaria panax]